MSEREKHPPYWFFHEYLDEARRMRVHKFTADTETEARRMHKRACEFLWVTQHVEPSVSALYTRGDRDHPISPARRPGQTADSGPIPMPDYIRRQLRTLRMGDEAALHDVRKTVSRDEVLAASDCARTSTEQDSFDTPF
jgi:hypothetical protein